MKNLRVTGVPPKILTKHLQNTNIEHYRYAKPTRSLHVHIFNIIKLIYDCGYII
jgi:hypothetical protein